MKAIEYLADKYIENHSHLLTPHCSRVLCVRDAFMDGFRVAREGAANLLNDKMLDCSCDHFLCDLGEEEIKKSSSDSEK